MEEIFIIAGSERLRISWKAPALKPHSEGTASKLYSAKN